MARIRTIKPEFFLSDDILGLQPLSRLLYIALWCHADKEGRLKNQRSLKFLTMPEEADQYEGCLGELLAAGLVVEYESGGKNYLCIPSFSRHQKVHHTERDSEIPEFNGELTVKEPLDNRKERKGREGKGKDKTLCQAESLTSDEIEKKPAKIHGYPAEEVHDLAARVVKHLNQKTGKHFQVVNGTVKPVMARIRELISKQGYGMTLEDAEVVCFVVVSEKVDEWLGTEQAKYLTTKTLFRESNFPNYAERIIAYRLKQKESNHVAH